MLCSIAAGAASLLSLQSLFLFFVFCLGLLLFSSDGFAVASSSAYELFLFVSRLLLLRASSLRFHCAFDTFCCDVAARPLLRTHFAHLIFSGRKRVLRTPPAEALRPVPQV